MVWPGSSVRRKAKISGLEVNRNLILCSLNILNFGSRRANHVINKLKAKLDSNTNACKEEWSLPSAYFNESLFPRISKERTESTASIKVTTSAKPIVAETMVVKETMLLLDGSCLFSFV